MNRPEINEGEQYAGVLLGKDDEPDHHVILLPGEAEGVTWKKAQKWAAKAGGELPTRREQSLLYANLPEQFKPTWYWSSTQHAADPDYAWVQDFGNGGQGYARQSYEYRARAIRRSKI